MEVVDAVALDLFPAVGHTGRPLAVQRRRFAVTPGVAIPQGHEDVVGDEGLRAADLPQRREEVLGVRAASAGCQRLTAERTLRNDHLGRGVCEHVDILRHDFLDDLLGNLVDDFDFLDDFLRKFRDDFLDHFLRHDLLDCDFLDHFLGDDDLDRDLLHHFLNDDGLNGDLFGHLPRDDSLDHLRLATRRQHGRARSPEQTGRRSAQQIAAS